MTSFRFLFSLFAASVFLLSCSSSPQRSTKNEVEPMSYKVRERRPNPAPAWVDDFSAWSRNQIQDTKGLDQTMRYYHGESGDVQDRILGCEVAELNAKKSISAEIASLVSSKLATTKSGQLFIDRDDPKSNTMRQHTEQIIAEKTLAAISGASAHQKYWEERDYSETGGSKRIYICEAVVQIPVKRLDDLLLEATRKAPEAFEDSEKKELVKQEFKSLSESFKGYYQNGNDKK